MSKFYYKAFKKNGEKYENTIDAQDRFFVYQHIKKEGGVVISVNNIDGVKIFEKIKILFNIFGKIKISEKIMFTRNLGVMLKAGLSISKALSILERQTKNKKFKNVLREISESIKKGSSLNEALLKFPKIFQPLFVSMVKAGEESGSLAESFFVIAKQMELSYGLKKKIKGALIYPAIIILTMFIIGTIMLIYVVPTLTQTFNELNVELPKSTQFIIAISEFITNNTFSAFILFVVIAILGIAGFRSKKGKRIFDYVVLHIPIISNIVKETNSARTSRALSSLLMSGVEVVSALSITMDIAQNSYYKEVLESSKESIQKGAPLSEQFIKNAHLYPLLVGEMIAVGEETGQLSDMLRQIAEFYEGEVEQKTKNMSTIIEPFLMIFIGAVVGFFAVSMISPIYSISAGI